MQGREAQEFVVHAAKPTWPKHSVFLKTQRGEMREGRDF